MSTRPSYQVYDTNYTLMCNLPTPAEGGVKITPERIWSQNAGRSSTTGKFTGDVIAVKHTVSITYDSLWESEVQPLFALTDTTTPFWILRYPLNTSVKSIHCYIAPPTYTVRRYDTERGEYRYEGITLEFIEQ